MDQIVAVIQDPRTGVATVLALACGLLVKALIAVNAERIKVQAKCDTLHELFGERNVKALIETANALKTIATNQQAQNAAQQTTFEAQRDTNRILLEFIARGRDS